MVAWNENLFSKEQGSTGRYAVAVRLKRSDGLKWLVASIYGPVLASLRDNLWEELTGVVSVFHGLPLLLGEISTCFWRQGIDLMVRAGKTPVRGILFLHIGDGITVNGSCGLCFPLAEYDRANYLIMT